MVKIALTGGAYTAHSVIASAQRCLNLFAEPMPTGNQYTGSTGQGEPSTHAHYPTPGTRLLGTIGTGPIRGIRQCTTGGVYVVSGDTLYSVDVSNWTGTLLGNLTAGLKTPVSMQDNGLDMVVVDGTTNGWQVTLADNTFAQIPSTTTQTPYTTAATFSVVAGTARYTPVDAASSGSVVSAAVTLGTGYSGLLKCTLFASAGAGPTDPLGSADLVGNPVAGVNILTFSTPIPVTAGARYWLGFDSDTTAGAWSVAAGGTGLASDTPFASFPETAPHIFFAPAVVVSLTISSDASGMFAGADRVDYLDTYFLLNKPGTPQFYISGSLAVTFDPLDFANKEAYSDLLVTVIVSHRLVYLLGERTSEVWYDAGATFSTTDPTVATSFQFAPMQSMVFIDHGCAAKYSPAEYDNMIFWLTKDRQGQGIVMMATGEKTTRVSTYAIEAEIAGYERISDAIGFCYQLAGHTFYVLTFPHADCTKVYDIATGLWHEWHWLDTNGVEHRHRANCFWPVNDTLVVGDWQNGNLYALDPTVFTDNGLPIKRLRSFPHMPNDGKRVFYRQFLADLETGNAPQLSVSVPAMAPYDLQLVQINTNVNGFGLGGGYMGFPSASHFSTLLYSQWLCGPGNTFGQCGIGPAFIPFFSFGLGSVQLLNNFTVGSGGFYNGTFAAPAAGVRAHMMLSVNTATQTVQVYINDQPVTVTGTWTGANIFFNFGGSSNSWDWDVSGVAATLLFPGVGDIWCANTPSFVDLSVVANRRKFINADLSPVYLGANGSAPFGYQPQIYCTVPTGGGPADILTNHGTGAGTFGHDQGPPTFQAPGTCTLPPAPPPPPPPLWQNLISLRWSDDRGHSWGSPVTQDIGEAGEYRTSLQWQRLAYARDRVFEISWSVPMRTALQGCWVDVTPAQS